MGFWSNISESFKDNNKGYSDKKVTLFMFMILACVNLFAIIVMCFLRIFRAVQVQDSTLEIVINGMTYTFELLLIVMASWVGIISIPQVLEIIYAARGVKPNKQPEVTVTTETQIKDAQ